MQIRNLSTVRIPIALWHELAEPLKVAGKLPDAVRDTVRMYGARTSLCVTVRPRRHVPAGEITTTGFYTYGRISLFPCTHCTPGLMTQVFLHELVHAWCHQYHEDSYWSSCDLAERFANAGFRVLGGRFRVENRCGSYRLSVRNAARNLSAFKILAASLVELPVDRIMQWGL